MSLRAKPQKRPKSCGYPTDDEVCMAWSQGGCLECERLHGAWRAYQDKLEPAKTKRGEAEQLADRVRDQAYGQASRNYEADIASIPNPRKVRNKAVGGKE